MATSPARRFPLPDLAGEAAGDTIEAFLSAPQQLRGRPSDSPEAFLRPMDPLVALDDRLTWNDALRRESARSRRYRRPAAVAVIGAEARAVASPLDGWLQRMAGPIAHAIRRAARETDLIARVGVARFQVLLPETTERQARHFAERVIADCEVWLRSVGAPVAVRAAVAGASANATLEDALDQALRTIQAPVPLS